MGRPDDRHAPGSPIAPIRRARLWVKINQRGILLGWLNATAKCNASVVFPDPPFWLMTEMIFIGKLYCSQYI